MTTYDIVNFARKQIYKMNNLLNFTDYEDKAVWFTDKDVIR